MFAWSFSKKSHSADYTLISRRVCNIMKICRPTTHVATTLNQEQIDQTLIQCYPPGQNFCIYLLLNLIHEYNHSNYLLIYISYNIPNRLILYFYSIHFYIINFSNFLPFPAHSNPVSVLSRLRRRLQNGQEFWPQQHCMVELQGMLSDMFRGLAMWVVGHCGEEVVDVSSTGAEVRRSADLQKQIFSLGNQKAEN